MLTLDPNSAGLEHPEHDSVGQVIQQHSSEAVLVTAMGSRKAAGSNDRAMRTPVAMA